MAAEKKYELTGEIRVFGNRILHRIKALRDFGDVKAGEIGGYIEKESNLSHHGECWVAPKACVFDNAKVYENAWVFNGANVYENARVYGNAGVGIDAFIYGDSYVYGNAHIYGRARVYENARVSGHAHVSDHARVYGNAKVCGYVCVSNDASVYGNAHVYGNAKVYENARVYGNAKVCGYTKVCGYGEVSDNDEAYMCNRVSHSTNEAHKNDDGKARVDLIPSLALIEIGKVLEFGAKKYGANNWRNGMHWSRFHGAALRHLLAWFGGENKDGESDLSHLAHAAFCILFLMECEAKQIGHDDRLRAKNGDKNEFK